VVSNPTTRQPFAAVPLRLDVSASGRPWADPAPRSHPSDYLFRAIAVAIKDYNEGHHRPILDVLKSAYGECDRTRVIMSRILRIKSAVIPADTTTSGWADTLVQTVIGDFTQSLLPISVYGKPNDRGRLYQVATLIGRLGR
jgi:hypothetical protein